MNIINSFTVRFSNFKGNLFNLDKRNKINSLKINIIINNTAKTKKDDNPDFSDDKDDFKYENKRKKRLYNKKTIIKMRKYGLLNQTNITKKKHLNFNFSNY